ncbi:MAG: phosphate ABC transporter substrate-binding protein [Pseudomonadota bacterium]
MRLPFFFLALCLSVPVLAADPGKLSLTGSSTIAPLALDLGKRFEKLNPAVRVDVQAGGSSRGITDARSGLADIGMVSRALKPDEADLTAYVVALDGITVILHRSNPVQALSNEQIIGIYTGQIRNWKEVGGKDLPITVVNKAEGRSTLELFLHYFKLKAPEVKAQVVIGDNQQGIKTVAGNPGAIGYVSIGAAEYEAEDGTPIKLLPVQGVAATVANVRNRSFPLSRSLNFVTKAPATGLSKRFLDFAQSRQAYDLIQDQFFVPVAH